MPKKKINRLLNKFDVWRLVQIALVGGIIALTGILVSELVIPLQSNNNTVNTSTINPIATTNLSEIVQAKSTGFQEITKIIRPGLFKSETPLRDKPMADKTIERIKFEFSRKDNYQ